MKTEEAHEPKPDNDQRHRRAGPHSLAGRPFSGRVRRARPVAGTDRLLRPACDGPGVRTIRRGGMGQGHGYLPPARQRRRGCPLPGARTWPAMRGRHSSGTSIQRGEEPVTGE